MRTGGRLALIALCAALVGWRIVRFADPVNKHIADLASPQELTRINAAHALTQRPDARAIDALVGAIDSPVSGVVGGVVVKALVAAGPGAVPRVLSVLEHGTDRQKEGAARYFLETRDPAGLAALKNAALNGSANVANEAALALGRFPGNAASDALLEILNAPAAPGMAKWQACGAMGARGDRRALSAALALSRSLNWSNGRVGCALVAYKLSPDDGAAAIARLLLEEEDYLHLQRLAQGFLPLPPPEISRALDVAASDGRVAVVAAAYPYFLHRPEPPEEMLIKSLDVYGDRRMAEDFLKSSRPALMAAGAAEAKRKGPKAIPVL